MVIPYDSDAETAVLGAAMTNRAWRESVLGQATADSFHVPAHRLIFDAIAKIHGRGAVPDLTALGLELGTKVPRERLLSIHAQTPLALDTPLSVLLDLALRRRLLGLADEISGAATDMGRDVGETVSAIGVEVENVQLPVDSFTPAREAMDFIEDEDDAYDWIVPRFLESMDRIIWTAGEGVGKSELQLQLAVMLAAGLHPFTRVPCPRLRVLLVDLENSERQIRRRIRRLINLAGDSYRGGLKLTDPRPAGIDLRNARDFRWLDRHCEQVRPQLLVIGPLYKAFRVRGGEKKTDETAAEEAAYALDRLRQRHGCAVSLEAHSPHGSGGDREGLRPYGASLWMRWPEFGFGLKPVPGEKAVDVKQWRGMRDRDRDIPERLFVGSRWSWEAA